MKDSGVEWLGEVPEHWIVERLKSSVANIVEQNTERRQRDIYLALENVESWMGRLRSADLEAPPDSQLKRFESGDVLFGKLRPYLAKVTCPAISGLCVGEFLVLRPHNSKFASRYVEQLLRSKPVIDIVDSSTYGAKMPRADWTFIGSMAVVRPSLPEQTAIVRFLDHADRRIRRYIRAKQKLIALLEEQKKAIIHQAVTGQIDVQTGKPYPAYKPSGMEWLGDVPEHWQLLRLKDVAQVQTGLTLGKDYRSTRTISRPYLRVANVQAGCLDLTHVKSIDVPQDEAARTTLLTGDVLMTEGGDIDKLGRGCVWRNEIPGCLHQNHVFAVRCGGLLSPEFLVGLMGSIHGRAYFEFTAKQTTNLASTNSSTLRKFPVLLPVLEEQAAILNVISEETNALDNAIGRAKREIDLIQEYRTRLIADVVTGKLDVREAAAELSDQGNETEPRDEFDDVTDKANIPDWTWAARNGRRTNRK